MLKAILIDKMDWEVIEAKDFDALKRMAGIQNNENWETALINDGEAPFEEVGLVMRDQDKRLAKNILGSKGKVAIVGYIRTPIKDGTLHTFESISDEDLINVEKALRHMKLFGMLRR